MDDEPLKSDQPGNSERPFDDDSANESLSKVPPTPVIEPVPGSWITPLMIATGAGVLALITMMPSVCLGATRSAKLRWQERQHQIEQAQIAEIDANGHASQRH
jgi:hypothetical protein